MKSSIILIGPVGVGKSTVAQLLAMRLSLPRRSMDDVRWDFYAEIGYDQDIAKRLRETEGFWGLYRYWKPFEAHAVERLLSFHDHCVVDFGAGHSVYEDDRLFHRVQHVLSPYFNVVLLLPTPNLDESLPILNDRNGYVPDGTPNINEHFIRHHSNYALAKHTVYANGRTPQEVCDEIADFVRRVPCDEQKAAG